MNYVTEEDFQKAKANGIDYMNVYNRVYNLGWEVDRAITTPIKKESFIAKYRPILQQHGISEAMFYSRIYQLGWDPEKAATTPRRTMSEISRKIWDNKGCLTESQIKQAAENGIKHSTLSSRVYRYKWPIERAITEPVHYNRRRKNAQ